MTPTRFSYLLVILAIVLAAGLGLATPFLTVFFAYFALDKLSFGGRKAVGVALFFVVVLTVGYAVYYFSQQAVTALPKIADHFLPALQRFATEYKLKLGFTDLESLKAETIGKLVEEIRTVSKQVTIFGKQMVQMIIGLVVALSLFANARLDLEEGTRPFENLYSITCCAVVERFRTLYRSFVTVMGAQIVISAINTLLTSLFVFWVSLPYAGLVVVVTFICGLLPIIGNLISNTVIVSIALTLSPKLGIVALAFLVVLHKFEYFLNSKIIGSRIKNPMWLTLLGLVVAERMMGIPGMILAPVILNYVKAEASRFPASGDAVPARPGQP
jgi:predicted PurR-regulated permease PerM